jgi:hypothetical protein
VPRKVPPKKRRSKRGPAKSSSVRSVKPSRKRAKPIVGSKKGTSVSPATRKRSKSSATPLRRSSPKRKSPKKPKPRASSPQPRKSSRSTSAKPKPSSRKDTTSRSRSKGGLRDRAVLGRDGRWRRHGKFCHPPSAKVSPVAKARAEASIRQLQRELESESRRRDDFRDLERKYRALKESLDRRKHFTRAEILRMREELRQLRQGLQRTAKLLEQDPHDVTSHLYPDGRAIAAIRVFRQHRESVEHVLLRIEDEWSTYPMGTRFEASLLFDPREAMCKIPYPLFKYGSRFQLQSFATTDIRELWLTLYKLWYEKLEPMGFPLPAIIMMRVGRTSDSTSPFLKKFRKR